MLQVKADLGRLGDLCTIGETGKAKLRSPSHGLGYGVYSVRNIVSNYTVSLHGKGW